MSSWWRRATIADLQKSGFTLISVAEPDLMASDPTRILMRQMLAAHLAATAGARHPRG
jgi:hypothetical protein